MTHDSSPTQTLLFGEAADPAPSRPTPASCQPAPAGKPRLRLPNRAQAEFRMVDLERWLPQDHVARIVWSFVETLDLKPLLSQIRATENHPGQPAIDPRLLLAVWLLGTIEGVGSSRELDRLCEEHLPYLWILGGVTVNYHTLSDFRVGHETFLDELLTNSLGALLAEGLVTLKRTAQDGMRVRASAGGSSFRSRGRLEQFQAEAREHVQQLKDEQQQDSAAASRRQQAAQQRAAAERQQRLQQALENLQEIEGHQEARHKGSSAKARASTTDPQARRMKMADGGFRPAYNVQFGTDGDSGLLVGCDVTHQGSDAGLMKPMVEQIEERLGQAPGAHLADGGFATLQDIEQVQEGRSTKVYTPVKDEDKKRAAGVDPFAARPKDTPAVAEWRARMGTSAGQAIYRQRGQSAEWVNARARQRGLYQFTVRGLLKVRAVVLWHVLAHNLIQAATLRARTRD